MRVADSVGVCSSKGTGAARTIPLASNTTAATPPRHFTIALRMTSLPLIGQRYQPARGVNPCCRSWDEARRAAANIKANGCGRGCVPGSVRPTGCNRPGAATQKVYSDPRSLRNGNPAFIWNHVLRVVYVNDLPYANYEGARQCVQSLGEL